MTKYKVARFYGAPCRLNSQRIQVRAVPKIQYFNKKDKITFD